MGDAASASYIRMVQHLIEKCLIFHMSQEECVEALFKHANIKPVITSTGAGKENREFFEAYDREMQHRAFQEDAMQAIHKLLSEFASRDPDE